MFIDVGAGAAVNSTKQNQMEFGVAIEANV